MMWCCLRDSTLAVMIQYWHVTDRQTHNNSIYCASVALCGKNLESRELQIGLGKVREMCGS